MTNETPGRPHVNGETVDSLRRVAWKMDWHVSRQDVHTLLAYIEQMELINHELADELAQHGGGCVAHAVDPDVLYAIEEELRNWGQDVNAAEDIGESLMGKGWLRDRPWQG